MTTEAGGRPTTHAAVGAALLALCLAAWGCRGSVQPDPPTGAAATDPAPPPQPVETPEPAPEATPLPAGIAPLLEPFTGDLDGMLERRVIRVLTVQSPIFYFVDRGREVGMTYETIKAFEKQLNQQLGNKEVRVHVVALPVARDQLFPRLLAGQGDIAIAALTITPERRREVAFSIPTATGIREVLVTGPDAPELATVEDLSGREVYVRPSSSYAEHLRALNRHLEQAGKPPVTVTPAPEVLEDGDILEMVSAGLVPATVVDEYEADLYLQVFPHLRKVSHIASAPGDFGWAFRKGSPKLEAAVNAFLQGHKQGTLAGNVLINKYLKTTKWVRNARSDEDRERFARMADLFKKYAEEYSFDYLLMAAQGYQESGLDQSRRSRAGAIGVMQVMPATARGKAINIPNIEVLESNIHAGIKYDRWLADTFFDDPAVKPLDKALLALASYNAGPSRVRDLRRRAAEEGLDPNRWFNNVELVAAKRIGRETVTYVSNVYKYYLAYQMMQQAYQAREAARERASASQTAE
jgi:membrane-bound lytic murein transglycosylase MltF